MRIIIVGFSKPKSKFALIGQLIRLYTGAEFSHCYIKFPASQLISQASKGTVNFTHEAVFLKNNEVVKEFHIPVTDVQFEQVARYAIMTAGKSYSVPQIIGIMIADLFRLNRNPLDVQKETFICSEYLGQILRLLGIQLTKHLSLLTPKDLYLKLRELYEKI